MVETSILTGKVVTSGTGPNTAVVKRLYIKIFPGEFSHRAPRPKKAKKLLGELLIRYSAREWPVKKNGDILGDPGFLEGVKELLRGLNVVNVDDMEYSPDQRELRDTITIRTGSVLAQELIDRNWGKID